MSNRHMFYFQKSQMPSSISEKSFTRPSNLLSELAFGKQESGMMVYIGGALMVYIMYPAAYSLLRLLITLDCCDRRLMDAEENGSHS